MSSHTHDHHPAHEVEDAHMDHDFAAANKHHHNEAGHSHGHVNSSLNIWLGGESGINRRFPLSDACRPAPGRVAEAILDAIDFDEDETTVLDFACGG